MKLTDEIKLCGGKETNLNRIHIRLTWTNDMPSQKTIRNTVVLMFFCFSCVRNRTVGLSESVQNEHKKTARKGC